MPVIYNEPLPVHEIILNNVMGRKKKLVGIKEASKELTRPITVTGMEVMKLPLCVNATKNITLKRAFRSGSASPLSIKDHQHPPPRWSEPSSALSGVAWCLPTCMKPSVPFPANQGCAWEKGVQKATSLVFKLHQWSFFTSKKSGNLCRVLSPLG